MSFPSSGYTLVISEKPDSARKISEALGRSHFFLRDGVEVIDVPNAFDGYHYVVVAASGHLYALSNSQRRSIYPDYDANWTPLIHSKRRARPKLAKNFVEKRIGVISYLSKQARGFVQACDYDIEGETLGFNILQFACERSAEECVRARFSTLAPDDVRNAFSSPEPIDEQLAIAGRMRHLIDFVWGINLSRALTEAFRRAKNRFRNITIGRVQGPTLSYLVEREMEIKTHVPIPYWTVSITFEKEGQKLTASNEEGKILTRSEADRTYNEVKEAGAAKVRSLHVSDDIEQPPFAFNLADLQYEAFRIYKFPPLRTLSIAEKLYLNALISYPRTESQRLPTSIGYREIIHSLAEYQEYSSLALKLLRNSILLLPRQGGKFDKAHPAVYPTGRLPGDSLGNPERRIYDLIVKRFLSTFAPSAVIESLTASLEANAHKFRLQSSWIRDAGWMLFYPSPKLRGNTPLPRMTQGEVVPIVSCQLNEKYTEVPSRFTSASLLKRMEQEEIGTSSTRAETVSTLLERGYVASYESSFLVATDLGLSVANSLNKVAPEILSTEMTRRVEESIRSVSEGKLDPSSSVHRSLGSLSTALSRLIEAETEIGSEISDGLKATDRSSQFLGKCPQCAGGELIVIRPRSGKRFIGCSNYQNGCRSSTPLPRRGSIKRVGECQVCKWPILKIWMKWGHRYVIECANLACKTRRDLS